MSSDSLQDIAAGAVQGLLSYSDDKINELVYLFTNRKLAFIQKRELIDLVKEQAKSGEWFLCKQYIKNKDLRILVQMGLTLRKLEKRPDALQDLRDKILEKYKATGLHVAQFVQNDILTTFIGSIASKVSTGTQISQKVEELLQNIDFYVVFLQARDDWNKKAQEVFIKLQTTAQDMLIIFSYKSAIENCLRMKAYLEEQTYNYIIETKTGKNFLLIFIFKEKNDFFPNN